jgi:hypothetical protein
MKVYIQETSLGLAMIDELNQVVAYDYRNPHPGYPSYCLPFNRAFHLANKWYPASMGFERVDDNLGIFVDKTQDLRDAFIKGYLSHKLLDDSKVGDCYEIDEDFPLVYDENFEQEFVIFNERT